MPRPTTERTVQPSILDRLRGDGSDREAATWRGSVQAYRAAVRRDLEWLLNSRRTPQPPPEGCEELRRSVFWYGLPDITSISRDSPEQRAKLLRQIEEAIGLFEPRLSEVRVRMLEGGGDDLRQIRFLVEALLRMDPSPERVVFDTVLKTGSGEFEVRDDVHA